MNNETMADETFYNINHWGEGYFQVNSHGNIEITNNPSKNGVELQSIVDAASQAGLQLPLLIRFTDILHNRVFRIYDAFTQAIEETGYTGNYELVYPIKVNQENCVVTGLLSAPGKKIGLEAGSKAELMAVIGLLSHRKSTIICNGYKDRCYIRMALIAQQMGHEVYIIIEKLAELGIIFREADSLNIKPHIGIRIRLATKCVGKWENTGGAKSKFGLNSHQILEVIDKLKARNWLDCLQLIHCHLGSQIANIYDINKCMKEVARYYVELHALQAPIRKIDVGGGLGVDYHGTQTNMDCSINYSVKEYATHILSAVRDLCAKSRLPEPDIISESGRALSAHHAVLITNITDVEVVKKTYIDPVMDLNDFQSARHIFNTYQTMTNSPLTKTYHFAEHALNEIYSMFKHGELSLTEKSKVEQIYNNICIEIQQKLDENNPADTELLEILNQRLAAKIFCNLSFFQSIPDAWAIGQIFPIIPISQLDKKPLMHCLLQDLTCDSDGTIKQYTGKTAVNSTLLLPPFDPENPYNIGFFLVGAYQEILGNLHNLFGDTNSMDVKLKDDGQFEINVLVSGDTIANVLNYAHFDTKKLLRSYEEQLNNTDLSQEIIQSYLNELRSIFTQSTYLKGKIT